MAALGVPLVTTGCLFPFGSPIERDEHFDVDENIYLPHDVKNSVTLRYSGGADYRHCLGECGS